MMGQSLNKEHSRNSLIELYRFFFALWVIYYHGYFFLPKSGLFSHGYLAVDFFFLLTGFFLIKSIEKGNGQYFWKGLGNLMWKKLKPLGITLVISLVFAQIYFWANIATELTDPLGFMWYIEWLLVCPAIHYTLYRLFKNKKAYYCLVATVVVISYVLLYTICKEWGVFRGLFGIGLGILLSLIPKNTWRIKKVNLNVFIVLLLVTGIFLFAMYNGYLQNTDHIFLLVLFPALLYFSSCVECHFQPFNVLGGLSFGMYAYQTLNRLFEYYNVLDDHKDNFALFAIVMGLAIIDYVIRIVVNNSKDRKIKNEQDNELTK